MPSITPDEIDQMRIAQGVCRHCGGKVPCWSSLGDRAVGKRHTIKSWETHRKDDLDRLSIERRNRENR